MKGSDFRISTPNEIAGRTISALVTIGGEATASQIIGAWRGVDVEYRDIVLRRMESIGIISIEKVKKPGRGRPKVVYRMTMEPSECQ